jgi:hypothetical protein
MDELTSTIEYDKKVIVPFRIEYLYESPYMVYYLEHSKNKLQFLKEIKKVSEKDLRGVMNWKECSYIFYEMTQIERDFLPCEKDDLYKVTPYEFLYTREVVGIPIHSDCTDFFKAHPKLCMIEEEEIPVVSYLGVGVSEIKEQILLQSTNEKVGIFGKGYYFYTYENAIYDAYYKEDTDDSLIRLENHIKSPERVIQNDKVELKGKSFFHGKHYLGDSNECNPHVKYSIYYYDDEVIYLKSSKPHHCQKEIHLRKESGYVMRYILFLKKHSMKKNTECDSYASDSLYMIKNSDHFICLSYHFIKKK